jgi:hypothetical protein
LKQGLTFVLDGYSALEHMYGFPSPIYKDVITLVAKSGTIMDPTITAGGGLVGGSYYYRMFNPHEEPRLQRFLSHYDLDRLSSQNGNAGSWQWDKLYLISAYARDMRAIIEAGGDVGVGSHGDVPGLKFHYEMWALASGGIRPIDVLRSATLSGAKSLGLTRELGSLEPGKLADLQVLDANPLDDIHKTRHIRYVMKNGRLYDAATLDEVWPRKKPLGRMWWWEEDTDARLPQR